MTQYLVVNIVGQIILFCQRKAYLSLIQHLSISPRRRWWSSHVLAPMAFSFRKGVHQYDNLWEPEGSRRHKAEHLLPAPATLLSAAPILGQRVGAGRAQGAGAVTSLGRASQSRAASVVGPTVARSLRAALWPGEGPQGAAIVARLPQPNVSAAGFAPPPWQTWKTERSPAPCPLTPVAQEPSREATRCSLWRSGTRWPCGAGTWSAIRAPSAGSRWWMPVLDVKLKTNRRIVLWSGENVIIPSTTAACPCGWNRTIAALSASRTGWSKESANESGGRYSSCSCVEPWGFLLSSALPRLELSKGTNSSNRRQWICGPWDSSKAWFSLFQFFFRRGGVVFRNALQLRR